MNKYKNRGIDMDGLSMTDPVRYRKINAVLNEKGKKKDLLDIVETIPFEYAYDLADGAPIAEDIVFDNELKNCINAALMTLKPREERVIRRRFGIGVNDATLEEIGQNFSVTRGRIRQIEAKALRKLKHPSNTKNLVNFLDVA